MFWWDFFGNNLSVVLKFFNVLFRLFLIFLICFIWVRYFISNLGLCLAITAILTFSFEILIRFFLDRKLAKNKLKAEEEKLAEKISSNFIFNPKLAQSYFLKLAKINHQAKKVGSYIEVFNKDDAAAKTVLYPCYSFSPISAQTVVEIIRKTEKSKPKKLVVCGYMISKEALDVAKKFPGLKIVLLGSKECFLKLIKPAGFYPENLKEVELSSKPKFKEVLKGAISKQRAKGYLLASLILLFSSFIVRMNIYYLVFSSILLILSFVCYFVPTRGQKLDDEIL